MRWGTNQSTICNNCCSLYYGWTGSGCSGRLENWHGSWLPRLMRKSPKVLIQNTDYYCRKYIFKNLNSHWFCFQMSLHFRYDVTKDDVKVHQRWDKRRVTTVGHDIALIKLPYAVETVNENADGNIVLPICLDWSSSGVCYILIHISCLDFI